MKDRLYRVFDRSGWCAYHDGTQWQYNDVVSRFERNEPIASRPRAPSRPQMFMNLASDVALTLYRRIKTAEHPHEAMNAFLEAVCAGGGDATHVALKGCDQITVFDALQEWRPEAKKIAIVRDGRDAALSALHFTRLMNELGAPSRGDPNRDYFDFLKVWCHRADLVATRSSRGELTVIRYEDLSRDFAATIRPLLDWLGLDHSDPLIDAIRKQASFERLTGRPRGTEANHPLRKGAVGEWIGALAADDKAKAWAIAQKQLSILGYTDDGRVSKMRDVPCSVSRLRSESEQVAFRCNICGHDNVTQRSNIGRELPSCAQCGSTVRWRSIVHVLSKQLLGTDLALAEWPTNVALTGIGMSDWDGYALPLSQKVSYRNTFYHSDPSLDITSLPPEMEGTLDFILTSDVFEHVAPPVSVAFANLRKLLKSTGVVVLTVPYRSYGQTVEHYPDLFQYTIETIGGRYMVVNTTKDGRRQVFDDPVFHGGPGATLEMRVFSESSLIDALSEAGFDEVVVHNEECAQHGIWWEFSPSVPISARTK